MTAKTKSTPFSELELVDQVRGVQFSNIFPECPPLFRIELVCEGALSYLWIGEHDSRLSPAKIDEAGKQRAYAAIGGEELIALSDALNTIVGRRPARGRGGRTGGAR